MSTPTLDLSALTLAAGGHSDRTEGTCLLEAVAWFAGEKHTDAPRCVSPVLRSAGIRLNDTLPHEARQKLIPLIPRLVGTANDGKDDARVNLALDRFARQILPDWLDRASQPEHAAKLRALSPVTDMATRDQARRAIHATRDAMYELRRAARERLKDAVRAELARRGHAAADAVADAAADADAAAVAAAVADAVAAAAAVAAAVADAAAAADAAAVADAVAAADAVAVAAAVAAAVAVADAAAAAAAVAVKSWGATYDAVYAKVKPIYKARFDEVFPGLREQSQDAAIALFESMIDPAQV